jgi:hypothetical protein
VGAGWSDHSIADNSLISDPKRSAPSLEHPHRAKIDKALYDILENVHMPIDEIIQEKRL